VTKDYGRPPRADQNRALVESRLEEASAGEGSRETLTVEWRGQQLHLDVIQLPVGDLYYNPATHRIRAQRSHDPRRDVLVEEDPWNPESQQYLDHLLKAPPANPAGIDPEFTALAASLTDYGQSEPGLVTRDGVLVNGNTRRAALLDLSGPTRSMRVAVLPASCTWADITDVELSLQLRKEHRRDYSYINRLLAIDELAAQGTNISVIASTFRTTIASCKQDQWVLSCIRSMIRRSEAHGSTLPLVAFEDHTEKLRELHRRYVKDSTVNPEKAELTMEARLAAIMLGFSKTDVRLIEPDFQDRYLASRLPQTLRLDPTPSDSVVIPGLGRSVKGPSQELASAKILTDTVLKARATEVALPSSPDAEVASRTELALREAMEQALNLAGKDARIRKRKQAAPDRLADASQDIEQCVTDLVMSRGSRSLDEEAFDEAVIKLKQSLHKLAVESRRTIAEPGDGVTWLLEALSVES
jgi:hypothetical protein